MANEHSVRTTQNEIAAAIAQLKKGNVKQYPGVMSLLHGLTLMNVERMKSVLDVINLGFLVYGLNPYENKPYVEQKPQAPGDPFDFEINFRGVEMEKKPGVWKFKYTERYIERALRIPYRYTPDVLKKDVKKITDVERFGITDHFLVGYEGGTGY